ncbi:MAG: ABC transporter permease [Rectinema subterraneum]|jgi:putative spermidine/putrescine transport system permease protein
MKAKTIDRIIIILALLYIVIPLTMLIVYSFSTFWQGLLPKGFTLKWYSFLFNNPKIFPSLVISLVVAFSAVILDIVIVLPGAYAINYIENTKFKSLLKQIFSILPLVFPPLIIGLGLMQSFNKPPFQISGTIYIVIIAHALLGFPFMFRNIDASLRTIDEITLSEAAASLGASFLQRMRRVIIPNIMPGILSGSLLVFAISFGEFEVTSMVAGFKTRTLPLVLFQQLRDDFRAASAMAAFLVYISLSALLVITTLQRKIE